MVAYEFPILTTKYNVGRANNTLNRRLRAYYWYGFISPYRQKCEVK